MTILFLSAELIDLALHLRQGVLDECELFLRVQV